MITDQRVLADDFIPREVVHRDPEIHTLAATLEPLLEDGDGRDSFIHGPPGTGKTCISQHALEQLDQEHPLLQYTYINCWEYYTRFKILYQALRGIGKTLDVHRQSTPTDELYSRLKDGLDRPYIIILDEVDQIADEKVLYDLYTIPEITLIMIATRETALHDLDNRIRSRLMSAQRIQFDPYDPDQLTDILTDRIDWGMAPGTIDSSLVRKIALAAEGDARIAISILRAAAMQAEAEGKEQITRDIVNQAVPEGKTVTRKNNIEKLNSHQKTLLDIINDSNIIKPGDLYSQYRDQVDDPKSERALRKYLKKMTRYDLIDAEGDGRWRKYKSKDV